MRFSRDAGSVLSPSPNRRSNTARGFTSMGLGVDGSAPGNGVGVGATVTGIATAHQARLFQTNFERCKLRRLAQFFGGDLVRGNARVDIGALGFLGMHAGQPGGARTRVIARPVAERPATHLRQAAQHI